MVINGLVPLIVESDRLRAVTLTCSAAESAKEVLITPAFSVATSVSLGNILDPEISILTSVELSVITGLPLESNART